MPWQTKRSRMASSATFAPATMRSLPGDRLAFRIGEAQVGWVKPDFATKLAAIPGRSAPMRLASRWQQARRLPAIARQLVGRRLFSLARRGVRHPCRTGWPGPGAARPRRAAELRRPGGGRARQRPGPPRPDGLHVWVARRAADKLLDPGKLDHIVAGGVPAGLTPAETLVKEAAEEAAIPASLAAQAVPVGSDRLRHGAPRGPAARPPALLRPGTAGGLLSRKPPTARWRRSSSGRSRASCRRSATPTSSSSTSTWC